jgi:hypothetical protein
MHGHFFSVILRNLGEFLRRWTVTLGQLETPLRSPDCSAYAALAELRRQRPAPRCYPNVIPFPRYLDDAQVKLRITM